VGSTLVQVCADTPAKVEAFRKEMEPLRQTLKTNQFLGGSKPNYADIAVAGNFLVRAWLWPSVLLSFPHGFCMQWQVTGHVQNAIQHQMLCLGRVLNLSQ